METDMVGRIPTRAARFLAALFAAGTLLAVAAGAAGATGTVIYNNIASPLPGNVASQAFEATQTSEWGGQIETAGPTPDTTKVSVAMSSWACESGGAEDGSCKSAAGAKFAWPVTLHIYTVGTGNAVGTQIAGLTRTFKMPYRPSANVKCTGEHLGGWVNRGICYHGKLFKITFTLVGVTIPSHAIVSVSYNTSDYGVAPTHCTGVDACPYDALNVGAMEGAPTVGKDPQPESAYVNSTWSGAYCDAGLSGMGAFRYDPPLPGKCAPGYDGIVAEGLQPGFEVTTG
jgi:hypothetical protein